MPVTIDPVEFTRLMTLPAGDRHTLLEFLGATYAGHVGTAELFRQATCGTALALDLRADRPRNPETH